MNLSQKIDLAADVEQMKGYLHKRNAVPAPEQLQGEEPEAVAAKLGEVLEFIQSLQTLQVPEQAGLSKQYEIDAADDIEIVTEPPLQWDKAGDSIIISIDPKYLRNWEDEILSIEEGAEES